MRLIKSAILCGTFAVYANAATLLHHYTFGLDASDQAGTENGALLNGATVSGGVLSLDGIDDYVQFASHLIPGLGSYSITLEGRLIGGFPTYTEMISQGASGTALYIGSSPGGGLRAGDQWGSVGSFPSDGAWHAYALTVDTDAQISILYIDGLVYNSLGSAIAPGPGGDDTRLGSQYNAHGEYFYGDLDNVRIYSGALTAAEVAGIEANAIPEPWSMTLTGAGLLLCGLRRLRPRVG